MVGIIILVIVVLLVVFAFVAFNKLRSLNVQVDEALGGIDVQLTRRADLIPNLVETVKGYAKHESGVFEEVTKARAGLKNAIENGTVQDRADAEAALDKAMVNVNAVAEQYPDLKASQNFMNLQNELATTENNISFARQYYNDAVSKLNTAVVTLPWLLFKGIAGVGEREFYKAPEGQATPPQVSFG